MFVPRPLPFPLLSWSIQFVTGCILIAIFIRFIAMWMNLNESNSFIRFVARITDPFLEPVRRFVGRVWIIDLSFFVVPFLIFTLRTLLLQSVMPLGW